MEDGAPGSGAGEAAANPGSLSLAVQAGLAGAGLPGLTAGVQRLMAAYRSGQPQQGPVLASARDAAAYAAYRMPATAAATAAALRQTRLSLQGWRPSTVLDLGAGTGGASWAAAAELASISGVVLLEQSPDAIRLGRAIFAESTSAVLQRADWRPWRLPAAGQPAGSLPAGPAELAVVAYVLGELTAAQQASLIGLATQAAPVVLLVEPGTPSGHRRILAARAALLEAGYQVAAPCPHQAGCPLAVAGDWCHFAARLPRSAMHRQLKAAELSFEDEKFSYVAAASPLVGTPDLPCARIVRRPQQRKGLVTLEECGRDGTARRVLIARSRGEVYRLARRASWGDRWDDLNPAEDADSDG